MPEARPFRLWRPALDPALIRARGLEGIWQPDYIWEAIVEAATSRELPGLPGCSRFRHESSCCRAGSGFDGVGDRTRPRDARGVCSQIEKFLREVPSILPSSVVADRIMGKPYLEIEIDRAR